MINGGEVASAAREYTGIWRYTEGPLSVRERFSAASGGRQSRVAADAPTPRVPGRGGGGGKIKRGDGTYGYRP